MARVRMLKTAAGPTFSLQSTIEYDLDGQLASALVRAGSAEFVKQEPEHAVAPEPEKRQERTELDEPWPIKVGPEEYLSRWPTGKYARLAKQKLER